MLSAPILAVALGSPRRTRLCVLVVYTIPTSMGSHRRRLRLVLVGVPLLLVGAPLLLVLVAALPLLDPSAWGRRWTGKASLAAGALAARDN